MSNSHWPDGTPKSQNNVFTQAWNGTPLDFTSLERSAAQSKRTSKSVDEAASQGINRGAMPGISRKSDERMVVNLIPKRMHNYTRAGDK